MLRLSNSEWGEVIRMAEQHAVVGLVFGALEFLPDDCLPPHDILLRLTAKEMAHEREFDRYVSTHQQLLDFFEKQGLRPVVLKGLEVARFYPHPEQRKMGDIDLFFRSDEEAVKARLILEQRGIVGKMDADHAYVYQWQGICVEHHPSVFDVYRPRNRKFLRRMEIQPDSYCCVQNYDVPSAIPCLLLQNTHILKHALGHGIGLRQLCDLAMAYRHFYGTYDANYYSQWIDNLKLGRWTTLLRDFCVRHLGLDELYLPGPTVVDGRCDRWLMSMLQSGDFGKMKRRSNTRGMGSKVRTLNAYLGNLSFALRYAPHEYMWLVLVQSVAKI